MRDDLKIYLTFVAMFVGFCIMLLLPNSRPEFGLWDKLYALLLFSLVVIYLASVTYLMGYLRRLHTATWAELGRPRLSAEWARSHPFQFARAGFLTIGFVFSNRHKKLEDKRLHGLIWLIRVLLVICLVLFSRVAHA